MKTFLWAQENWSLTGLPLLTFAFLMSIVQPGLNSVSSTWQVAGGRLFFWLINEESAAAVRAWMGMRLKLQLWGKPNTMQCTSAFLLGS